MGKLADSIWSGIEKGVSAIEPDSGRKKPAASPSAKESKDGKDGKDNKEEALPSSSAPPLHRLYSTSAERSVSALPPLPSCSCRARVFCSRESTSLPRSSGVAALTRSDVAGRNRTANSAPADHFLLVSQSVWRRRPRRWPARCRLSPARLSDSCSSAPGTNRG